MNRHQRRTAAQLLRKESATYPDQLISVPQAEWPSREPGMISLWRSRRFLVQVYDEGNSVVRLSVCKTAIQSSGRWEDNITWDDLQEIKSQCEYGQYDAIEIYPRDKDVVNVANMRHLWVFPALIAWAWRNEGNDQTAIKSQPVDQFCDKHCDTCTEQHCCISSDLSCAMSRKMNVELWEGKDEA